MLESKKNWYRRNQCKTRIQQSEHRREQRGIQNIRPDLTEELYAKRILGEGLTILNKQELFNPTFRVGNSWERWSEIARELTEADMLAG